MRKITSAILVSFMIFGSQVSAYSLSSIREHDDNISYLKGELTSIIESEGRYFESFIENGGKCDYESKDFREIGNEVYKKSDKLTGINKLDYLSDDKYKDLKEEEKLLNEKRSLLKNGGIMTTTRYLSDGTEVTEETQGYNGEYDGRLEDIKEEMDEMREYFKIYSLRMDDASGEINEWVTLKLLGECGNYLGDYRKKIKAEEEQNQVQEDDKTEEHEEEIVLDNRYLILYNKLDKIEEKKPGILKKLLPSFIKLKGKKKYESQSVLIDVIINYIEENY